MKIEADRSLTFEKWPVAFIDKNSLDEAGFYYTDHSDVVCCAFCVAQIGRWQEGDDAFKEHVGVRIASFLEFNLSGTSLLVLPTILPHRLRCLPTAMSCVDIIWNIDPIHIENDVGILACFSKCAAFIAPPLIFNLLFSYESQNT